MQPTRSERFASMYEAHLGHVLAYARRRLGRPEEAEEVAAETFIVAWRRFGEIPGEPLPWLYGVARHTILNVRRSERRRKDLVRALEDEGLRVGELAERLPLVVAEDVRLTHALDTLTADEREALLLVAWEELTSAQAAQVMGVSRSTFTRRLTAARQNLRRALDNGDLAGGVGGSAHSTLSEGTP